MMSKVQYCWRCEMVVPMLDEQEWEQMLPLLHQALQDVKDYRQLHDVSLAKAKEVAYGISALTFYHELTGFNETNLDALWHHRLSMYGESCAACGKPLRTPHAKHCAACGTQK